MMKLGIIGTGTIVERFLEAVKEEKRIDIIAIYSRSEEKAKQFSEKHNIPEYYTSLEQMASSTSIDAAYIASPNSLHAAHSILFMQNKKHVLCEKALASNAKEVKEMIRVSQDNNVVLMEALKSTLSPCFLEAKKQIEEIGTIRRYFASYCQYSSRYDKYKEGIILNAFKPELSNGALMDIGVYTIYPMVVLFGKPNKISACGTLLSTGVDGQGAINFEYDNLVATVLYSKITDSFLPSEIQGEDGTFILDRIDFARDLKIQKRNNNKAISIANATMNEFLCEINEFVNVIESGKIESDINSHKNSLITMEIMDEIRKQLKISFPADL